MAESLNRHPRWTIDRDSFDRSPAIVFYEITQACQLVCRHCRACAQRQPHPAELTPAESRRLLAQLSEFPQPPAVVITAAIHWSAPTCSA